MGRLMGCFRKNVEAPQTCSTHPSIEGSRPEHRSLGKGDLILAINSETNPQFPNSAGANATIVGGHTPLHQAAAMGQKDVVDALLLKGNLNVGVATSDGITALHIAAYRGHEMIVTALLPWYSRNPAADVNARDKKMGRTALHYAVEGGHLRIVEVLSKFPGIDICPENSQNLTPLFMALSQRRGDCSLPLVRTLIDAEPDQVSRALSPHAMLIDDSTWLQSCLTELFTSDAVLQNVSGVRPKEESGTSEQENRNKFREIEEERRRTDRSTSPGDWERISNVRVANVDWQRTYSPKSTTEEELDRYKKYKCPVAGHTVLHVAATQNNAEVLSHVLSNCPSANVNILTADGSGMTPLHCAIRADSTESIDVLMSHPDVDVNARLKSRVDLALPPWTELTVRTWWSRKKSEPFRFYKATCVSDTPLHLAIRCCSSRTLRRIGMQFCNHPRFQPSIYNESGCNSLDLAWLRSSCSLHYGNSSVDLHSFLDTLERQPGNELLMNEVNSLKKRSQRVVIFALAAAMLIGGMTISSLLKPPFDAATGSNARAVRFFWVYDCMSFYFSIYTILYCLGTIITTWQHTQRITGGINTTSTSLRVFFDLDYAQLLICVFFCFVTKAGSLIGASLANLPPDSRTPVMMVYVILGLLLVLIQAVHSLDSMVKNAGLPIVFCVVSGVGCLISGDFDTWTLDSLTLVIIVVNILLLLIMTIDSVVKNSALYLVLKAGVETQFHDLHNLLLGLVYWCPRQLLCLPCRPRRDIPLDQNMFITLIKLAILPIHVFVIMGITWYTFITDTG
ncbi:hypothetical protein MPTK1_1g02150 [Marchantia polymorpha subsp. ruderalis]|uniref:PGG domain-containing protein n=2 Tax=Marchantia polymorpha TaxID=3197 RepID=A0AAF6AKM3_MARPO|nr:hypothetical protein MARPO_0029s0032 [Marchantia polymorpha]BBM96993.1 hypothetical protein Mp_1g02150 [Marchantia polymorpha subsp. ruderalis]|eukprot:PTQ42489.1 hypothetical protein MARPO_0029s0032 [Marchantia polymorpha]